MLFELADFVIEHFGIFCQGLGHKFEITNPVSNRPTAILLLAKAALGIARVDVNDANLISIVLGTLEKLGRPTHLLPRSFIVRRSLETS